MACLSLYVLLGALVVSPPVSSTTLDQNRFTPIAEGFYLPERDVYGSLSYGATIFASFPRNCMNVVPEPQNSQKSTFFQENKSFYEHVSVSTGISASLKGKFTMGTTLSVASENIASLKTGQRDRTIA